METQQCVQLVMYLMLGLILLSFPVKLEGSHGLSVDDSGGPDSISSLQCSQEYISKSYFGKHVSFLDSDFHGYLVHELPLGLCKALPRSLDSVVKVSVFQRNLIGEGSHRSLVSPIKFHLQEGISELPEHFCQAVVVEKLPSGVFADPFEIQHLVQRGVFVDAAVFGDTNLELPSALSNRSVVEIHMDLGHNILSRHRKVLEVNIVLPLHARYPSKNSYQCGHLGHMAKDCSFFPIGDFPNDPIHGHADNEHERSYSTHGVCRHASTHCVSDEFVDSDDKPDRGDRMSGLLRLLEKQLDVKLDIFVFRGRGLADVYVEWVYRVEKIFQVKNYKDPRWVHLVKAQLKDIALNWWKNVKIARAAKMYRPILKWAKMKR